MAVLGLVKKRSATIIAMTLCDARVLSRKSLEEAINEFPQALDGHLSRSKYLFMMSDM